MNFRRILENGYGKLAEKLPSSDKEWLNGYRQAIEDLKNFKSNIGDGVYSEIEAFAKIQEEIAECTVDNAIEHLQCECDKYTVYFVDHNHYSLDEYGNIVDDEVNQHEAKTE